MADDIAQWLEGLGLGQYAQTFAENDIGLAVLPRLTEDDLKELGLSIGHRRTLQAALERLSTVASSDSVAQHGVSSATDPTTTGDAERRQLTVMFCDLVGSTALSRQLDPEDLRDVMRRYQDAVAGAVTRYGGHVAKYLGDGMLAYFGWPQAYEDQAERAVRAGLDAIHATNNVQLSDGNALAARVGIATGHVVVGDLVGESGRDAEAVSGETPNLAARLQAVAAPGQVVVGETTRRLIGQSFNVDDLGSHDLKGFDDAVPAWGVVGEVKAESRFDAAHGAALTRLVGRETELQLLLDRWHLAEDGEGQAVFISGEAGIGKSRLMRGLRDQVAATDHIRIRCQCSPYHANSALYPTIQQLEHAAGFAPDDDGEARLDKLEALLREAGEEVVEDAPLYANLMSLAYEDRYGALTQPAQQIKERLLEALITQLVKLAEQRSVLFLFEDAHWIDPTSQEMLERTIGRLQEARVLLIITHRPEWQLPFAGHNHVTALQLNRLGKAQGAQIVRAIAGAYVPDDVVERIVQRTDGVPLYIEELTKTLVESGLDIAEADIPATLQASLLARLDRLGPEAKEIAQIGAVIGREFSHDLMVSVANKSGGELNAALDWLTQSELVFRSGSPPEVKYIFKHALIQDTAFESLLKSRRQQLHAQIAQTLGAQADTAPELLARHYSEAGLNDKALSYWQQAGERAAERSSNAEAVVHLKQALALLKELPAGRAHDEREFELLIKLGPALMGTLGWSDVFVKENYERAQKLCRDSDRPSDTFTATWGLWMHAQSRSEHRDAEAIAETLLSSARQASDIELQLQAHHAAWTTCLYTGRLAIACDHINSGLALYDADAHGHHALLYAGHDPGVCGNCQLAIALWLLGYPEQAEKSTRQGLSLARKLQHAPTIAHANNFAARFEIMNRNPGLATSYADTAIALGKEMGLPVSFFQGSITRGWVRVQAGDGEAGLAQISEANAMRLKTNHRSAAPHYLGMFGEAYLMVGRLQEADGEIDEALRLAAETEERVWEAELLRLRGEIRRQQGGFGDAEEIMRSAIKNAARQDAKSLELRAALSLACLWVEQDRRSEARDLLQPVYDWFTEGFDTPDLKDAKALLDELA